MLNVSNTKPFFEQLSEIGQPAQPRPKTIPTVEGLENNLNKIQNHRKCEKGYHFVRLIKGKLNHDAK